jgi:hypothetical protein
VVAVAVRAELWEETACGRAVAGDTLSSYEARKLMQWMMW